MQRARVVLLLLLCFSVSRYTYSQSDSCALHVSLLTCSPGEELYSAFGHTALRVKSSATGMDIVFNYGTFDDSEPTKFYWDFTRGLMFYSLSAYGFSDFVEEYRSQQRGVIEQELQLSCAEKSKIFNALRDNAQPQNRNYYYYFHLDNCTTRAGDMIIKNTDSPVVFKNILPAKTPSYRNLLHAYLDKGHQPWSKFGIDILLGSNLDKKVSNREAMFLPDYLMKGFDSASSGAKPLVLKTEPVVIVSTTAVETGSWFTPFVLFTGLLIFITILSILTGSRSSAFLRGFDIFFFLLLGLLGVLLATLWLIRVDDVCRNNFNLLWALPTHFVVVFVMNRQKQWVKSYFKVVCIISLLLGATWFILPQALNPAIAPILGLILVRSWYRSKI
ncbi:MAG: DUF4105 domain-containing protein [Niastella sp.]|nr:DUF4105 domain-containing protein [Niastella sp.]